MKYFLALILLFCASVSSPKKSFGSDDSSRAKIQKHRMTITETLKKYTDKWMTIPGVTGTGEGQSDHKPCIMIFTNGNEAFIKTKIPNTVNGYKVVFHETGEIHAH
jgi:hypothetical protein